MREVTAEIFLKEVERDYCVSYLYHNITGMAKKQSAALHETPNILIYFSKLRYLGFRKPCIFSFYPIPCFGRILFLLFLNQRLASHFRRHLKTHDIEDCRCYVGEDTILDCRVLLVCHIHARNRVQ